MLTRLKKILTGGPASDPAREHERIQVATCVILLELSHADRDFHSVEETLVQDLLRQRFDLSSEAVEELIEFAQAERVQSLDLFQFTKTINETFSREEKLALMETLWELVYADGILDKYEEYLMRQLANLLRVSHREMIEAKVAVLDRRRRSG